MPIVYPKFFEDSLMRDRSLRAGVDGMVLAFDGWLSSSRLPFFTDYTDHGIDHLNCVLETADNLIVKAARDLFTPSDTAVLIASILLHDSAMHLSEAGFYSLIQGEASHWNTNVFSDQPWPTLWDEFLFSAKRWDSQRLKDVLGESSNGEPRAQVRDPFIDYDNLIDTDRKLIGEFIRRHHPRMAHEFACFGVPGKKVVELGTTLAENLRDIAGLVARSHGLPIRACLKYLQEKYHRREYDGVHAVYLMTLLRISDYLQIQSARAPAIVFQYRHIPSKFSEQEWKAHNAISNITQTHDDPESIEIQANPEDVHTYLRLKEWLSGIQEELDASWAVLGEIYGSQPKLSQLGLILRRVRSNLDHPELFSSQVEYVPERIELSVTRPDLLKLLVGPLYDNIPSVGIRELMQNAVDAVREREILQKKYPELRDAVLLEQEYDVEIWLDSPDEGGDSWLTISDRGTGMSVEIIRDYFLTAGATFRNSDAWKREFEIDDAPHSRVLRAGRFGVGVLAGFLLGSRMEVATRHIRGDVGIRFSTTLELNAIELRRDPTLQVGTVIRIRIPLATRQNLLEYGGRVFIPRRFDWFVYEWPSVVRFQGRDRKRLISKYISPPPDPNNAPWLRQLLGSYAYSVYWTYFPFPNLSVNGLFITDASTRGTNPRGYSRNYIYSDSNEGLKFSISHPKICVEDPDGAFPLNLQRSDMSVREYPFKTELIADVIDDFLAYLLVRCPENHAEGDWRMLNRHPGLHLGSIETRGEMYTTKWLPLLACGKGITLFSSLLRSGIQRSFVYLFSTSTPISIMEMSRDSDSIFSSAANLDDKNWQEQTLNTAQPFWALLEVANNLWSRSNKLFNQLIGNQQLSGLRLLVPNQIAVTIAHPDQWIAEAIRKIETQKALAVRSKKTYHEPKLKEIEKFLRRGVNAFKIEKTFGDYSFLSTPNCPPSGLDFAKVASNGNEILLLEICLDRDSRVVSSHEASPLTKRWGEVIRQPIIPFDLTARRRELQYAYDVLGSSIRSHELMKRKGVLY